MEEYMSKQCEAPGCTNDARIRFCSNKCKDRYHNINNPRGKFAHLNTANMTDDEYYDSTTHPFSGEALGQD